MRHLVTLANASSALGRHPPRKSHFSLVQPNTTSALKSFAWCCRQRSWGNHTTTQHWELFWSAGNRNKMVKFLPTGLESLRTCTSADVHLFLHTHQRLSPHHVKDWCSCITPIHFLLQSTPLPRNRGQKWDRVRCNCKNYRNVGHTALLLLFPHSYTEEAAKHFTQASDKLKPGWRKDQKPQIATQTRRRAGKITDSTMPGGPASGKGIC